MGLDHVTNSVPGGSHREILAFGGMLPSRISAQDEERLLNQVKSRIRITSPKDELIRITYQDSDRLRTYKVANKLAAELQSINRYEAQAFSLADEGAQEVVQRIADDKKEHVARLLDLLRRLDVKQREKIERVGPPA